MSLSTSPTPSLSELLSAPSLDPYVAYLDDALLSQLYGQPPPLPAAPPSATTGLPSSAASASASSTPSVSAPQSALAAVDAALLSCLSAAWRCCLQLDADPSPPLHHSAARSAAAATHGSSDASDVSGAVSSFLLSLAELDASVRSESASSSLPLVPASLLSMMDEGRNPELILSSALTTASDVNDAVRGRIIAAEALRTALQQYREREGKAA